MRFSLFLNLFKILLSSVVCPVICRLIATLYSSQTPIVNGVLLSPKRSQSVPVCSRMGFYHLYCLVCKSIICLISLTKSRAVCYIVFTNDNDCDTSVLFNNQMISSVSSELQLGHTIGNQVSQQCFKSTTNNFFQKSNYIVCSSQIHL